MQFDSAFMFGEEDAATVALALTAVAATLTETETDAERQARKARIVGLKLQLLRKLDRRLHEAATTPNQLLEALAGRVEAWPDTKRDALLIEVAFASPFAPYEVKLTDKQHQQALRGFAATIGLSEQRADDVMASIASARRAHRHIEWGKIAAGIVIGSVVVAAGGYLAAPLIAGQLGAAAGLSGAAAVSHGLALIGGGSLAVGGGGMAGGMALITTVGAGVGAIGLGGANALWNAGYAAAVTELVKLQVSYREILLRGHLREHAAAEVIEQLIAQRHELRLKIVEEKDLNDSGARRVKDLERIERGYDDAIEWLEEQKGVKNDVSEEPARQSAGRDETNSVDGTLEQRVLGSFGRDAELDSLDILATGCVGAVGAALDILLVAVPKDVVYLGRHEQKGSVLTKLFKSWVVPSDNALSAESEVPFDVVSGEPRVPGMFPGNHRFMTPGHDPLLGLAVGVHDILRNGRTAIGTDGQLRFDQIYGETASGLGAAVVFELLHLLSDVATKAGLPAPLMTAAGLLRLGSFGASERTVADLARYMYLEGYDLRHFVTTCTVPAGIRLLLGAYVLGRRYVDDAYAEGWRARARADGTLLSHPSFEAMLFMADSVACAANAGKIALYQGNPSAFNYGQWLALLHSARTFASNQLESPTDVLIDRANANEESLRKRWTHIADALGLEEDAFLGALAADPRDL